MMKKESPYIRSIDWIKNEKDAKIQKLQRDLNTERAKYNAKIIKDLYGARNYIINYQFSPAMNKKLTEYGKDVESDGFVILNPLHGYPSKGNIKRRNDKGAFGGGQFRVSKEKDRTWKIDDSEYRHDLESDWSRCRLSEMSMDMNEKQFTKETDKCVRSMSDDLKVLQFIDKMAKTKPNLIEKYFEY